MKYRVKETNNRFIPEWSSDGNVWYTIVASNIHTRADAEKAIDIYAGNIENKKIRIHEYNPGKNKQQLLD